MWQSVAIVVGVLVVLAAIAWTPDRSLSAIKARWANAPSQFIALDGMQVHFRDEGPRDDPTPIMMLHGTGSSLHTWQGLADRLKQNHRVIRFDRPGFGITGPNLSGDYSMRGYSDFLEHLLDHLNIERVVLVGNSSGGRMAWEFAVAHPKRVSKLVLIAPAGYPRSTPLPYGFRVAMSPSAGVVLEHILPRSQVRKGLESSYGNPALVTDEAVDRNFDLALRPGNRKALGETLRQAQGTDNSASIKLIAMPTLLIWGAKDTVIPPNPDVEFFQRDVRDVTLVMLVGLGHLAQEEDPAATTAALLSFVESSAAGVIR